MLWLIQKYKRCFKSEITNARLKIECHKIFWDFFHLKKKNYAKGLYN